MVRTWMMPIAAALICASVSDARAQQWNPQPGWKDSYAVEGRCYCDSNFDHGIGGKSVDTPVGRRGVRQVCADIRRVLGSGSTRGRVYYNDIQCGNGPANDAGDEAGCPGRVDSGPAGCDVIGPKWDLAAVYARSGDPAPAPSSAPGAGEACTAVGAGLEEAKDAFAERCPRIAREDCDPLGDGRWLCSSNNIASGSVPPIPTTPTPVPATPAPAPSAPAPVPAAPAPAPAAGEACTAVGAGLEEAKDAFAERCPRIAREDCDPLGDGRWLCSSSNIASGSVPPIPTTPAPAPSTPAPSSPAPSTPAPAPVPPVAGGESCSATAGGLGAARDAFASRCAGFRRVDCDPVGGGRWQCSSAVLGARASSDGGGPVIAPPSPSVPSTPAPAPDPRPGGAPDVGRLAAGDLLALHFDNCPDRDDGHAAAADKAVLAANAITGVLVVNGTCGDRIRGRYQPSSERVMRVVYGDFVDAFGGGSAAVNDVADTWAATLANGNDVWVAEGGPSDFTARVLRRLGSAYPSVDRKRVRVVQHSSGSSFNESSTSRDNIDLVKRAADYITIPDGNFAGNGSADLNRRSDFFVDTARSSRFAAEWNAAFDYLNPNERLDFSDTVELLYIVGDTATRTVDDFARRYLR